MVVSIYSIIPRLKSGLYLNLGRSLYLGFNKLRLIITPALPSLPGSALGLLCLFSIQTIPTTAVNLSLVRLLSYTSHSVLAS